MVEILHVYVLEDENKIIKIGIASNVAKRMKAIENGCAYQITRYYESPSCANAAQIEKATHKYFADRRKKGEWFNVPFEEAVDFVKGHFVETAQQLALSVDTQPEQSEIIIGDTNLPVLVYNNQRVITFAMMDAVHKRPEGTASRNFRANRERFIEGEDFYLIDFAQKDEFRRFEIPTRGLIMLTQMGYLMLVKSFTDDLAWQIQRQLVNRYFATPAQSQPVSLTPEVEACIAARVQDVMTNTLATPVKFPESDAAENEKAERLLDWLHGPTAAEHFKDGYINHTQIYMRGLRFARNPKDALKYMMLLEECGHVSLVIRGRSRLWELSDKGPPEWLIWLIG